MRRRVVVAAAAVAVAVRLAYAAHVGPRLTWPDAHGYVDLAEDLLAGRPYELPWHGGLKSLYMPGYAVLLAAARGAFGVEGGYRALQVLQALLGGLVVVAAARLAERCRAGAGVWAAWLFALEPWSVYFAGHVLTETVGVSLLALGVLLLLEGVEPDRRPIVPAAAGVVLGLAALVRAVAWVVGWGAIAAVALVRGPRAWGRLAVAGGALLLVLSPWAGRNHLLHGHLVFTSTDGGRNVYGANRPGVTPQTFAAEPEVLLVFDDLFKNRGEYEADRLLKDLALAWALSHPFEFAYLAVGRTGRLWAPLPNYAGAGRLEAAASLVAWLALVPLAVVALLGGAGVGPARALRPAAGRLAEVAAPVVVLTLLHAATTASIRYRLPAHPFLCALAGAGAAAAADYFRMMRSARRP